MKILHLSRNMGQGGAQKIVYQLCKDNSGFEQVVASSGGYYVNEISKLGIKHYSIPDIGCKKPLIMLRILYRLINITRKEHIDIIHTHHRMAAFYARIVCAMTGSIHVYTAHNVFGDKRILMRFSLKKAKIVAVGNTVKNNLVSFYSINEDRITVINNSVNVHRTKKENELLIKLKRNGKVLIGCIGRLSKEKRVDVFLSCISKITINNKEVMGIVVGDGDERQYLEQYAGKLGISDRIVFMGYQRDVLGIISQLDIILFTTCKEGLPLTPIEVFSQGKVIIASNIDAIGEIVKNGFNGLLCNVDDINDFVESTERILCDKKLKKYIEENARNTYLEKFSYDKFISAYKKVYLNINVYRR